MLIKNIGSISTIKYKHNIHTISLNDFDVEITLQFS
jgi:hypothetical protein